MSLLKVSVLSLSGLTLWLAPPFLFSRKVPLHNFMQGVALVSGFACCFEGRRCALLVAKSEEFEAIKNAAVAADLVDEISTSVYVSEQQRRNEAELLIASSSDRELLERALALSSDCENDEADKLAVNEESERAERALGLKAKGWGKAKIILEVWGVSKGGSQKYRDAEAAYHRAIDGTEAGE